MQDTRYPSRLRGRDFWLGLFAGVTLLLTTGFVVQKNEPAATVGRYQASISDNGATLVLVDTTTGETWIRPASGAALAKAPFQRVGKP